MKTRHCSIIACLILFAGCATPQERYTTAEQTVGLAADGVATAVNAGLITNKSDLKAIKLALDTANADLQTAHDKLIAATTQPSDDAGAKAAEAKFYTDSAFDAANKLLAYLATLEAKK